MQSGLHVTYQALNPNLFGKVATTLELVTSLFEAAFESRRTCWWNDCHIHK